MIAAFITCLVDGVEAFVIEVGSIHDIERTGLKRKMVQDMNIVRFSRKNKDKLRYAPLKIHTRMNLDGRLDAAPSRVILSLLLIQIPGKRFGTLSSPE